MEGERERERERERENESGERERGDPENICYNSLGKLDESKLGQLINY